MDILNFVVLIIVIVSAIFLGFLLIRLNISISNKLKDVQSSYTNHLEGSQNTLVNIHERLSELKSTAENILNVGQSIKTLEDVLKPPKLRGAFSELLLENALSQILPSQYYEMYHRFQTGNIVDAVVRFQNSKILCIDAKFPLDSVKKYFQNRQDETPSQFIRDVKKHIDDISSKYIVPSEGTMDFALMYIPAENVYYEIILKEEKLLQHAKDKHVFPVSPLGLYLYLSTVIIGLRGYELEKNAQKILSSIDDIKIGFENLLPEFNTLGQHITNAKTKYDLLRNEVLDFSNKLKNLDNIKK